MSGYLASALYAGHVTHARSRPRVHRLAYDIWSLLIDLDEVPLLASRFRLLSIDRFNLFSFHSKDRGDGSGGDLRAQVEAHMTAAGLAPDGGRILLLTMPRVLGWSFNPLSVFFCYRKSGELSAILWEVDNTFGERHGYLIPAGPAEAGGEIRQTCAKSFYVSPFMDMQLSYAFRVRPPAETFSIHIEAADENGSVLTARHLGRRHELTDRALLRAFLSVPFQTLRVLGGIHWEALKIWRKGIRLRDRPPPPEALVSFEQSASKREEVLSS